VNTARPGGGGLSAFCVLLGSYEIFSVAALSSLYSDYGDYVDQTAPAVRAVADQGFILRADAPRLKQMYKEFPALRPTAPELNKKKTSTGKLKLTWRGTEAPASTFTLQHSKNGGKKWTAVKGAKALTKPKFKFGRKGEKNGKWIYQVRSKTIVPANVESPETTITTPWSAASRKVKVDRKKDGKKDGKPAR